MLWSYSSAIANIPGPLKALSAAYELPKPVSSDMTDLQKCIQTRAEHANVRLRFGVRIWIWLTVRENRQFGRNSVSESLESLLTIDIEYWIYANSAFQASSAPAGLFTWSPAQCVSPGALYFSQWTQTCACLSLKWFLQISHGTTCNSPSKLLDCGACFYFIENLLYS